MTEERDEKAGDCFSGGRIRCAWITPKSVIKPASLVFFRNYPRNTFFSKDNHSDNYDQCSSIRACRHKQDTIHELSPVVKRMIRKAIDHVSLSILTRGGDGRVIVDACCVPANAQAPYCAATQLSGSRIWIFSICFTHHYSEYVSQR
ncbi:hypothetical protein IGI04_006812 [Brassica rapa subsp. trilocularis]|uniref:Uncharacterized protein n=1 Tax=Brassica rapa subsp. trilocularis TaxID=1813537 RepID=A0ABQ7MVG5_BRACM|nr:hypothetical protein IGI04_008802 [Brassica rapa subsp. trilocularis]KAG5410493.1 hypothetical protein IGI04_006812 [Brassica rapa subsp. trilocularis]